MTEVKKMAEALRSGATMLAEPCPTCSSPLFRFSSGEVRCVNCSTVVSPGVEERQPEESDTVLSLLERKTLQILSESSRRLDTANSTEEILEVVERCLEILERIRNLRRDPSSRGAT